VEFRGIEGRPLSARKKRKKGLLWRGDTDYGRLLPHRREKKESTSSVNADVPGNIERPSFLIGEGKGMLARCEEYQGKFFWPCKIRTPSRREKGTPSSIFHLRNPHPRKGRGGSLPFPSSSIDRAEKGRGGLFL